jgi:AcrR family transcriptional regulator
MPMLRVAFTTRSVPGGFVAASALGVIHAASSLYWAAGGTLLVWSLGSDLVESFRAGVAARPDRGGQADRGRGSARAGPIGLAGRARHTVGVLAGCSSPHDLGWSEHRGGQPGARRCDPTGVGLRPTIRAVAADASIDASMVMRYYISKEGLFAAATEIDLALPDLSHVPRERLGEAVAEHFLSRWEENDSGTPLRGLLSSALAGSTAAEKMTAIFRSQLTPVIAAANVGNTTEAAERAGLVATQILGFALCRYVLRLPPIVALEREAAVRWLAPTIQSGAAPLQ